MTRKIIVNVGPYETRAAILENEVLQELFFDVKDTEKIVGCIFKGRVANIMSGMQSAFVNIGQQKDAFLTLSSVESVAGADSEEDFKDVYRNLIQDMIKVGQEVLVQVLKEPSAGKGPRSTMILSLPGRYLVLTPLVDHIGVSRIIGNETERERLRSIGRKVCPKGMGIILRTAAEGVEERELNSDLKFLLKLWRKIEEKAKSMPLFSLIHQDLSLPMKLVRDFFTDDVSKFVIDSAEEYKSILEVCDFLSPLQRASMELYEGDVPLFEKFGIENEIKNALQKKLWLKSGGYIFLERTEALVSIDVNSGRFSGGSGLEETVFRVNMEAAKEIARQVRIRNLAGVIVIDFIDMENPKHRDQVVKSLREAFKGDRNRPHILDISELGLVQMTRRRTSHSIEEILKSECPRCGGDGVTLSVSTIANRIRKTVLEDAKRFDTEKIIVTGHPEVVFFFKEDEEFRLKELAARANREVIFVEDKTCSIEAFKIEPVLSQSKMEPLK
ncbi:Rne/Rng family ribonuclease [bacterium]|nr:Rne/Rng family ribonuclease [bacterium]